MSIGETDLIDIVARREDGSICLFLTDHLAWGDNDHLLALQEKLNAYIAYVETGQVLELDGVTKDTQIEVSVVVMHEPDEAGRDFLFRAGEIMAKAGLPLTWRVGP